MFGVIIFKAHFTGVMKLLLADPFDKNGIARFLINNTSTCAFVGGENMCYVFVVFNDIIVSKY